ncbi:MAG: hypothetical protein ACLRM9_00230 [Collinsella aerofaciens]
MGLTSYGDVFNLINSTVAVPVMFLGSSARAVVAYFVLCNLLFFFGIHPSVLMGVYMPVIQACGLANIEAYLAGEPLPYLAFIVLFSVGSVDALGMELALLTAKSERYKTLSGCSGARHLQHLRAHYLWYAHCHEPLYVHPLHPAQAGGLHCCRRRPDARSGQCI